MALGWEFHVRRPITGRWLWVGCPLQARVTPGELSGPGYLTGTIPAALDQELAEDGQPMWLERGTLVYAEQGRQLQRGGVYVVTYTAALPGGGRTVEAVGLTGALEWMPYDGELIEWNPDPFDVVQAMLDHVQAYPNGNLELALERVNPAPRGAGDEQPPPRPPKPPRRDGESREDYDDRLLLWEMEVDEWEAEYADREKYQLVWWESPLVGAELTELAAEVPFDYREHHEWVDRDAMRARHVLQVGGSLRRRRHDLKLVDGVNLAERPQPETDADDYANDVIVLGAGEGRDMRRGRSWVLDGRLRSTRFVSFKDVRGRRRLNNIASRERRRAAMLTTLDSVRVWDVGGYASVSTLRAGDEVWVESPYTTPSFAGWRTVAQVTHSTVDAVVEVRFAAAEPVLGPPGDEVLEPVPAPPEPEPTDPPPDAPGTPNPTPEPPTGNGAFRVAVGNMNFKMERNGGLIQWLAARADALLLCECPDFVVADYLPAGWTAFQNTGGRNARDEPVDAARAGSVVAIRNAVLTKVDEGLTFGVAGGETMRDRYIKWVDVKDNDNNRVRLVACHYPPGRYREKHAAYTRNLRPLLQNLPGGVQGVILGSDVNQDFQKAAQKLGVTGRGRRLMLLGNKGVQVRDFIAHRKRTGTDHALLTGRVKF